MSQSGSETGLAIRRFLTNQKFPLHLCIRFLDYIFKFACHSLPFFSLQFIQAKYISDMDTLPEQPVYVIVPSPGPSIESDRLRLRPVTDSDTPALFAIRSRWEVAQMKYVLILF